MDIKIDKLILKQQADRLCLERGFVQRVAAVIGDAQVNVAVFFTRP